MDLGPQIVKNSYQYLLVQSGANPIRLGANGSVNWSAGGVVDNSSTQTIAGTKTFSSTIVGSINGNAATVTNGVYLVGDQTIAGTKTFSSNVNANITGNAGSVTNGIYATGNQTISGVKTFASTVSASITGNAGSVTNGVYLTGNQTIAGTKTFSSTVNASITGNAGSVTNGVYVTGNQTIGGVKTFSSTVNANITGNAGSVTSGVYFRLNTPPSQITQEDENKVLLLQYGDSVWFKDDNNVSILLAGSGNQGGGNEPIVTNVSLNSDESVTSLGTFPSAGKYRVRLDNFVSSNYVGGGDGFGIGRDNVNFPTGVFSNIIIDDADGMYLTTENSSLNSEGQLVLDVTQDYDSWTNVMFIEFLVTVDTSFNWQGYDFIQELESGMNVDFTVTITPEEYTVVYTLTETLTALSGGINPVNSVTLPSGEYVVNIAVSNINMLNWGENLIKFDSSASSTIFSEPNVNTLASLVVLGGGTAVEFQIGDPSFEPDQNGSLVVNINEEATISFSNTSFLPSENDSVDVTITFE